MQNHDNERNRNQSYEGEQGRRSSEDFRNNRDENRRNFNYDRAVDQDYGGYDSMGYGNRGRDMGSQGYTAGGMSSSGRGQEYGRDNYSQSRAGYGGGYGQRDYERQGYGSSRGYGDQDYRGQRYGGTQDYGSHDMSGGRDFEGRDRGFYGDQGEGMSRQGYGRETYGQGAGMSGMRDYGQHQSRSQHEYEGSRSRASHRGKGPKGYRRDDNRIKEDVCERLSDSEEIDASEIEVKVNEGEVILEGSIPERFMKRMAEDLVESISGVKDVNNQLRVKRQSMGESSSRGRTESQSPTTFGSSTAGENQRGEQKKAS